MRWQEGQSCSSIKERGFQKNMLRWYKQNYKWNFPLTSDCGAFHLPLVVDDNAGVVLEVDELSVLPPEGFPLADYDGGHHLLPQLRLSLLDGAENLARGHT